MIELKQVTFRYDNAPENAHSIRNINLTIQNGECVVLCGRSGCGKTTLLRMIAGLEKPESGTVTFKGERKTPSLSVVFQEPRLFPWLTVEENIALAVRHEPHSVQKEKTGRMLEMIGLTQSARAKPRELSGGMAQRVSLARALVSEPDILLMDEAFSALDALTRTRVRNEFIRLWQAHPMTVVLVTHDVLEATLLASHITRLSEGRAITAYPVSFSYPRNLATPGLSALSESILNDFFTDEGPTKNET